MVKTLGILRPIATAASLAALLAVAGCTAPGAVAELGDLSTGSLPTPPSPDDQPKLRAYAQDMAGRYAAHPEDRATAIRYAGTLRALTQYAQAAAVLQRLAVKYPHDMTVLGAYGKSLADAGRLAEAADVLARAHTPEQPNWSILSAQGSVADQMGNHAQAQAYYATALKIVPDQPGILSNLGLSYALERRMPLAEDTLRQAAALPAADARVRQNLALVLTARGKYAEAEEVSRRDMASIDAAENVQALRRTIAQSDAWKGVAQPDAGGPRRKVAANSRRPSLPDGEERTRTAAAE